MADVLNENAEGVKDAVAAVQPEEVVSQTEETAVQEPIEEPTEVEAEVSNEAEASTEEPVKESDTEEDKADAENPVETEEEPAVATDELVVDLSGEEDLEPEDAAKTVEVPETKEGIVERLRVLAEHSEQSEKVELDLLKQAFYRILKEEKSKAYNDFLENGGKPEEYKPQAEPLEEEFKAQMAIVKANRSKLFEAAEKQKEVNLEKKRAIIEQIKALATSPEEASKGYDAFRKLQEEWKEIKPIPASAANEVWKSFQVVVETFYDLLKENNALREYDFKKNLEAKTLLCEAAEKLADEPDIINASHQLQQLHQEFREIGPVAKDLREDLWNRFKAASTAVNRRHAQYFEQLKAKEEENLAKKTAFCEEIENIETANLGSYSEWERFTAKIIELQRQWREVGRAPKKMNTKIFDRFRAACDNFFSKKAEYFKELKKSFAENTAKKTALCEQAEALKESTDWNATSNKLVQLQKEWKEIGPTAYKVSNALWERFNGACNYFFEQKKKAVGGQRKEEQSNLTAKRTIIDKLEAVLVEGGEQAAEKVRALMDEWNATGHVPFREKDKIYAKYHDVVDRLFKELNLSSLRRTRGQRGGGERGASSIREAVAARGASLYRLYETKKAELATYENNISFLTAHSKSGNALIDSMVKKIEDLKADLENLVARIKAQEEQEANPQKAQEEAPVAEAVAEENEEKAAETTPAETAEKETPAEENA